MLNDTICKSKVLLFLGAGATNALGKPLMKEFMETFIPEFSKKYEEKDKIAEEILQLLVSSEKNDLEEILSWVESFKDNNLPVVKAAKKRIKPVIRYPAATIKDHLEYFVGSVSTIANEIKSEIFEQYGEVDADKCNNLFGQLIDYLTKFNAEILPIFTTNYDPAVEDFVENSSSDFQFIDGFSRKPLSRRSIWDRKEYDNFQKVKEQSVIALFKLHGSVRWYENEKKQIIYSDVPTVRPSGEKKNMIIWPTKNKIAINDPFFTGYEYLHHCLQHSECAVFIGYSFRDYDSLTKIKSGLIHNSQLEVVIIDPQVEKLVKDNFDGFGEKIYQIPRMWDENNKDDILNEVKTKMTQVRS